MKKVTSVFFISIAVLATTFFSCKLKIEDENLYDKPLVHATNKQVTIVIPMMNTDTKYINVYRKDVSKNSDPVNIGILFHPTSLEKDEKNYVYIDKLVKKGHSYQYSARYNIAGRYYKTEWSDTVNLDKNGDFYADGVYFNYRLNDAILIYEKTQNTIHFDKMLTQPDFPEFSTENYKPMLIIKNSKTTQAFELSNEVVRNSDPVPLVGLLPADFLDTDISIEAIVGQKTIYDNDKPPIEQRQIKSVIWTEPTTVKVVGDGADKTINVKSQTGKEGLDYSRKAN